MLTATEVIGPVVRMCGNAECGGGKACDRAPAEPLMGTIEWLEPGRFSDEEVAELFVQELIFSCASDSTGVQHIVPDGAEFTVHKGSAGMPEASAHPGLEAFAAFYSGPAASRDEALEGVALYDDEFIPIHRWQKARDAGRFLNLARYGDPRNFLRETA